METLAEYLKQSREKKGVRLEEIASITKIHIRNLEQLEAGKWEELPPEPFIRGFITAYSKYVGLDPKEVLVRFREERGAKPAASLDVEDSLEAEEEEQLPASPPDENPSEIIETNRQIFDRKAVYAIAGVAIVAVVGTFIWLGKKTDTNYLDQVHLETKTGTVVAENKPAPIGEQIPVPAVLAKEDVKAPAVETKREVAAATAAPQVEEKKPEPAKEEAKATAAPAAAAATTATTTAAAATTPEKTNEVAGPVAPETAAHVLEVEGKEQKTWAKIVVDDEKPKEFFLNAGDKVTYKAASKIKLVLGISSYATVKYNGEVTTGEKYNGTIYSFIYPKNARFPQDQPAKRNVAAQPSASAAPAAEEKKTE